MIISVSSIHGQTVDESKLLRELGQGIHYGSFTDIREVMMRYEAKIPKHLIGEDQIIRTNSYGIGKSYKCYLIGSGYMVGDEGGYYKILCPVEDEYGKNLKKFIEKHNEYLRFLTKDGYLEGQGTHLATQALAIANRALSDIPNAGTYKERKELLKNIRSHRPPVSESGSTKRRIKLWISDNEFRFVKVEKSSSEVIPDWFIKSKGKTGDDGVYAWAIGYCTYFIPKTMSRTYEYNVAKNEAYDKLNNHLKVMGVLSRRTGVISETSVNIIGNSNSSMSTTSMGVREVTGGIRTSNTEEFMISGPGIIAVGVRTKINR